jgi:hypothetical protein
MIVSTQPAGTRFRAGDLVRRGKLYRIVGVDPLTGQRMRKDGLLPDLRCQEEFSWDGGHYFCLACHGAHHVQRCPAIRALLLREGE